MHVGSSIIVTDTTTRANTCGNQVNNMLFIQWTTKIVINIPIIYNVTYVGGLRPRRKGWEQNKKVLSSGKTVTEKTKL
jgi:hypothetical protein